MEIPSSREVARRKRMGRKAVARDLPALDRVYHGLRGFGDDQHKRDLLEKAMRAVIGQLQVRERVPFYAMREVADFFQVSLQTVIFVYHKLQNDGLITTVRGSQTFLEARRMRSNVPLRGVVGIPVYLPSFVVGPQPRGFYIDLEERLRRHGYLVDFIFTRDIDQTSEDILLHLRRHKMDIIIWPGGGGVAKIRECLLRIQDNGVKLVSISQDDKPLPGRRYFVDFQPAIVELARHWKQRGIRRVFLIGSRKEQNIRQKLSAYLPDQGMKIDWIDCPPPQLTDLAARRSSADEAYIFLGYRNYETLCNYNWQAMRAIFQSRSCLLAQGPIFHPGFQTEPLLVEAMQIPFAAMTKKMVDDFVSQSAFDGKQLDTFPVEFRAGFDLSTLSESI